MSSKAGKKPGRETDETLQSVENTLTLMKGYFELLKPLSAELLILRIKKKIHLPPNKALVPGMYVMHWNTVIYIFDATYTESFDEDSAFDLSLSPLKASNGTLITLGHLMHYILTYGDYKGTKEQRAQIEAFIKEHWITESPKAENSEQLTLFTDVEDTAQAIESLKSIIPINAIKPNNKLANEITKDFVNEGEIALRVSKAGAKREITTKAILTYEDKNISLSGRAKFTPYDREVHDGVVTLYEVGNEIVTPSMVYRAMNGMTETEKISPQAVGAVTRSLDKSRKTTLKIDFSQEAQFYKKDCKATYEGYLLACDKVTVTAGGKTQEGYKLLRKPILYEYSQMTKQVITVPIRLLQTKGAVRSTEDVIVIRGYLLRQIIGMKSPVFKRSNKITYEGIYAELDISPEHYSQGVYKKKTHTMRQHIEAILSEWVDQQFIKSFKPYIEGKAYKGISVTL